MMSLFKYLKSKSFLKTISLITVTAVILFFLLQLFLRTTTRHGHFVTVPDLTGKTIEEVNEQLKSLSLEPIIKDIGNYNPNYKDSSILNQIPSANSKVKIQRKIYLTLNASDFEMVEIPNVTKITVRQAKELIESLGFVFGEVEYVDDIARDEVISISNNGIDINVGDYLKRNSIIDFKLGNGKQ